MMVDEDIRTELTSLRREFSAHVRENNTLMFGQNGEPGVLERMRVLERYANAQQRIVTILVAAFLLSASAIVWNAVTYYLTQRQG